MKKGCPGTILVREAGFESISNQSGADREKRREDARTQEGGWRVEDPLSIVSRDHPENSTIMRDVPVSAVRCSC